MAEADSQEQVIRLLAQTQEKLLRYVLVLLPDWNAAQEVVQNTHVVVWKKSADFHSDTEDDFYRWAKQIAFYEVKKYLKRQASNPTLLDPEIALLISDEFSDMESELDHRREALSTCMEKLAPKDQELLRLRYWGEESVANMAARMGRTIEAVYKALQRTRKALLKCIEREARRTSHG